MSPNKSIEMEFSIKTIENNKKKLHMYAHAMFISIYKSDQTRALAHSVFINSSDKRQQPPSKFDQYPIVLVLLNILTCMQTQKQTFRYVRNMHQIIFHFYRQDWNLGMAYTVEHTCTYALQYIHPLLSNCNLYTIHIYDVCVPLFAYFQVENIYIHICDTLWFFMQ